MPAAMAGEKRDGFSGEPAENVVIRGPAPRGVDGNFFLGLEAGHGIKSAAADDADLRVVQSRASGKNAGMLILLGGYASRISLELHRGDFGQLQDAALPESARWLGRRGARDSGVLRSHADP